MTIAIVDSQPTDGAALGMIDALSKRLAEITGSDGRTHFTPETLGPRACFLLAMDGAQALGCGALRPLGATGAADVGEIKRMYAHVAGRGIGRLLLAALEERARGFGYRLVKLETRKVNQAAVAFYLGHGYTVCGNYGPYVGRLDAVCFEKRLLDTE